MVSCQRERETKRKRRETKGVMELAERQGKMSSMECCVFVRVGVILRGRGVWCVDRKLRVMAIVASTGLLVCQ